MRGKSPNVGPELKSAERLASRDLKLQTDIRFWSIFSFCTFVEYALGGFFFRLIVGRSLAYATVVNIEFAVLLIALVNLGYFGVVYLVHSRHAAETKAHPTTPSFTPPRVPNGEVKRFDILSALGFLSSFLRHREDPNKSRLDDTSFRSTRSWSNGSYIGLFESRNNKMAGSVFLKSQVQELLARGPPSASSSFNEASFVSLPSSNSSFNYQVGTDERPPSSKSVETMMEEIKAFVEASSAPSDGARPRTPSTSDEFRRPSPFRRRRRSSSPTGSADTSVGSRRGLSRMARTAGTPERAENVPAELAKVLNRYYINAAELPQCELKMRIWLCNTVLRPLVKQIDELNKKLGPSGLHSQVRIGQTLPEQIHASLEQRDDLRTTALPYVLPYLRCASNQAYLVQRIRELSANVALQEFTWNAGGTQTVRDSKSGMPRDVQWSAQLQLPTDAELVWLLFCAYMDGHLTADPFAAGVNYAKPFSSIHSLRKPASPIPVQKASNAFYVQMLEAQPPVFELVVNGGRETITPPQGPHNLWYTLILFIAHADVCNGGRLGHLTIDASGFNLLDVIMP